MKEIVIKIPDNMLDVIKNSENTTWLAVTYGNQLVWQVKNGKELPKGHGRLIDADELFDKIQFADFSSSDDINTALFSICDAPTIIEADKQ